MKSLSECTILIVDDTKINIDILVNALGEDYDVSVAMDGESALEDVANSAPDLILLDIMMPGMDGYEVLGKLKADPAAKDIPVIFCTAMTQIEDEEKGLELGAVDYIRKPFSPPIVKARVKNHLDLKLAREKVKERNSILRENMRLREHVERITQHDLKTPLNAFINLPALMMEEGGLSENQVELLGMLKESAYRMLEMIDSSLNLYKMEIGAYLLCPAPVDLLKSISNILNETKGIVKKKKLDAQIWLGEKRAGDADKFFVDGEDLLCYSMLANLVKNAFEASPEGGTIRIAVDNVAGFPTVSIHNAGAIPADIRDRFLDKYATSGKKAGTGLGVYSAALIAKTLGGRIDFETSEEAGTTLTIRFSEGVKAPAAESPARSLASAVPPTRTPSGD